MDKFETYDKERCKNLSSEHYIVYEWEGKILKKKTYTRKYIPDSKNGYVDNFKSEVI